jgi:hypothetical protein
MRDFEQEECHGSAQGRACTRRACESRRACELLSRVGGIVQ